MKKTLLILLLLTLLVSACSLPLALAQDVTEEERQALIGQLEHLDGRGILAADFQRHPGNDQPCAFVVTTDNIKKPGSSPAFAHWYLIADAPPQLIMDGLNLGEGYEGMAGAFAATNLLQGFLHNNKLYFVVTIMADGFTGEMSMLYHAGEKELENLLGISYGVWHPQTGLLDTSMVCVNDSWSEDDILLMPVFTSVSPEGLLALGAVEIDEEDLKSLDNGNDLVRQIRKLRQKLTSLHYLPNNVVVANFKGKGSKGTIYYCLFIGIEDNKGTFVRYNFKKLSDVQKSAQKGKPIWIKEKQASKALMPGNYPISENELSPDAFLDADPSLAPLFGWD